MIDLKSVSGLPLLFDEAGNVLLSHEMRVPSPAFRRLRDMTEVSLDKDGAGETILYSMYRDICRAEDFDRLQSNNLRFDITVIPPGRIGKEFTKTAGHYHPVKPGTNLTYPEVYEVLHGTAHYLLQKTDNKDFSNIRDVMVVEAWAGEKVVIPPDYGHITINGSSEPLVMSNWVEREFKSVYQPIVDHGGGAYFGLVKDGKIDWMKNPRHPNPPSVKVMRPRAIPEFGLEFGKPMYLTGMAAIEKLKFLVYPESVDWKAKQLFEEIKVTA